jgi:hypothetical protein
LAQVAQVVVVEMMVTVATAAILYLEVLHLLLVVEAALVALAVL